MSMSTHVGMPPRHGGSKRRPEALRWALLLGILLVAGPAMDQGALADVKLSEDLLEWLPGEDHGGVILTLSGPTGTMRKEFAAGEPVSLRLGDEPGQRLPDGRYKFEMRAAPKLDSAQRARLDKARQSSDIGAQRELTQILNARSRIRSGSFVVVGGKIADPETTEPVAEERTADGTGSQVEGDLRVTGDLKVAGTKSFVTEDPERPGLSIHYVALEGPEAGTYFRGTARTVDGVAVIDLPRHFATLTEEDGLTVQLTPVGGWSRLYVAGRSPERLTIREADGRDGIVFDYLVQGARIGYGNFEVERTDQQEDEETKGGRR